MLFIASERATVPCCPGGVAVPAVLVTLVPVAADVPVAAVPSGRGRLRRRLGRVMNFGSGRTSRSSEVLVAA